MIIFHFPALFTHFCDFHGNSTIQKILVLTMIQPCNVPSLAFGYLNFFIIGFCVIITFCDLFYHEFVILNQFSVTVGLIENGIN